MCLQTATDDAVKGLGLSGRPIWLHSEISRFITTVCKPQERTGVSILGLRVASLQILDMGAWALHGVVGVMGVADGS